MTEHEIKLTQKQRDAVVRAFKRRFPVFNANDWGVAEMLSLLLAETIDRAARAGRARAIFRLYQCKEECDRGPQA